MKSIRSLVIFLFCFIVAIIFPLFFILEPSGKSGNYTLGKTVDLDNVTFQVGHYGGTLYTATSSDPKTFNLVMAHETSSTETIGELFEGLTEVDLKTLKPRGALAESWEFKNDGLKWIFHLRKGVKWFDGKEFTADDVVFTYNQIYFNPKIPNSTKDMFLIDGKLPKVKKIDKYTVEFDLPEPFAPLLYSLSAPIFPKHVLEEAVKSGKFMETWTVSTPPEKLIGTGPYKLVKYVPGQYLVYERNRDYWKKDEEGKTLPYIDKKVKFILPDQNTQLLKFKAGELDFYGVRGDDFPELKSGEKKGNYTIYNLGPSLTADFICFNQKKGAIPDWKWKLFTNRKFRWAISHAIDRKGIILTVYNGLGYPVYSPVTPANKLYYDSSYPKFPYNLEKAKKLLEEIGLKDRNGDGWLETPDGHKVEFNLLTNSNNPSRVQIGAIIKYDLKRLGIDVHFQPLDFNNLVEKLLHTHDFDAVIIGLTGSIDPNGGRNVWMSSGQLHMWNPNQKKPATKWEAEVDRLFEEGARELDFKKRVEIYKKAYRIISYEQPLIYIAAPLVLEAARNRVKNFFPTVWGTYEAEKMFIEKNGK
ncbi:extracellular solute-binding protein family 5 [Desulfurobacterium thermolithotrophum DSM 11699]|uniref:Extracellular solute-binding protein family 5 n=1 Tax=Desulfurobacterium thermolithotrophum (strain DSM 11699 / BSA) TaxID=868864 RepID=F0S1P7_DESTD|nr:ABC transporter substrate-binding protein [Desulfurobacterium thermolithotrophum]ADY72902.1 extracellular solute-binding protein family 5 [Desulfurobacterium thermolithotrophum DSM 11699]